MAPFTGLFDARRCIEQDVVGVTGALRVRAIAFEGWCMTDVTVLARASCFARVGV